MKKSICLLFSLLAVFAVSHAQKVVKVGAFNFYPAIFQDADGEVKGFYVDALTELGKQENIQFKYVYGSWDEGLDRIKSGEIDLLTSVAFTEERLRYMDYTSTPLLTVWSEVYVDQRSEINGILDLKGKTIAIMKSDFNGGYLKQLTEKLGIGCKFIETADFEEVFTLVAAKNVDAGVVNNTFGASKSAEYGLRSSGIIFNPFDIFFTVKKGANAELLNLLNRSLHGWKHDRTSVYNIARQKWSHGKVGAIEVFPKWLQTAMYAVAFVVLLLVIFIGLLRYKVGQATQKVKYSELLFKTFMENTPAYVYIKDHHLNHIYRNVMVNQVNHEAPDGSQSSAKTVFEPHIAELVEKADNEVLSAEKRHFDLLYQCRLNGENVWLHDYKFYLKLPNGNPAIGGISFDITHLKATEFELIKAKEKAEENERLLKKIAENYPNSMITIVEKDLTIGFSAGQEFTRLHLDPKVYVGLTLDKVFGAHTEFVTQRFMQTFYGTETTFELFINNQYQLFKTVPLFDEKNEISRILAVIENITERKLYEIEIHKLNEKLEQRVIDRTEQLEVANKELEAFSYSVSHDLRTPLRALNGFANILSEEYAPVLDHEGKRLLKVISENATKMGCLIDDLLSFSRLSRTPIVPSPVNMKTMAMAVYNELVADAGKSNIRFTVHDIPDAHGDSSMIKQVWVNLIGNAIKFSSKKDESLIEVGVITGEGEHIYYVKDNGAGFEMEYAAKLFGVFQRLHSVKDFDGIGAGLAIVRRIILRHSGRIWAEGKVNEGATFYFTLPYKAFPSKENSDNQLTDSV